MICDFYLDKQALTSKNERDYNNFNFESSSFWINPSKIVLK